MLEFIVELVLEVFGDIILQVGIELLADFGLECLGKLLRPRKSLSPVAGTLGLLVIGGLLGVISGSLLPHRLFPLAPVPGASLFLAPIGAGIAMHFFGVWRRIRGGNPTLVATFWGGAAFAFSMALVRWLMVGQD